ncbi:sensor histidine kinase [Saccharomonospora sp. NPDC046836]|uniref:sensor histidine kinase n=1 Tax=Saccharomonospora sp. NPDC046836 TaxID=3156921 RepID=UPI0033D25273
MKDARADHPSSWLLPVDGKSPWGPWLRRLERGLAPVLLAVSTVLSAAQGPPWGQWWPTLALAGLALAWVLLTDTFLPARLRTPWLLALLFAGTLALAAVLMSRDIVFLVFMIACFFSSFELRPLPVVLLGLAATSTLINSMASGGPLQALRDWPAPFITIVIVQTVAIGGGFVMSRQLVERNEQRRKAMAELEAALEENAGLHRQLLTQAREAGVLDERQRLSREIHDTLAQGFTGIVTQLQAAQEAKEDPQLWQRHLTAATALARENLQEARRAVRALSPSALESAGLPDALGGVVARWSERTGVAATFTTTGTVQALHPEIEATLLRITQEALTNVAKHARASRVGLTLSYMEDLVTLDVRDDGVGFDGDRTRPSRDGDHGFGLAGMRHRLHRLAGSLVVESEPGSGTAISASVPAITAREA